MTKDDIILSEVTYGRMTLADLFAPKKRKIISCRMRCQDTGMEVEAQYKARGDGISEGFTFKLKENHFYDVSELRELSQLAASMADLIDEMNTK